MNASQSATLARPVSLSLFDRKPFYTLAAAVGFGLISGAGLLMLALGVLGGDLAGAAPFVLMLLAPGLLGLFFTWKVGRWGFIVAGLLALVLLGLFAPILPFMLAHPEGGTDFIVVTLFLAGALLGIAGSAVSVAQWRRRTAVPGASPRQRLGLTAAVGLTLAVVLASVVLSMLARTSLAAEVRASAKPVGMKNFAYTEAVLNVSAGETVRLAVRNDDTALHTFTLAEAGIDVAIPPGAERLIEFQAPAAGTYKWYCVPHSSETELGRDGMVGTLVVGP